MAERAREVTQQLRRRGEDFAGTVQHLAKNPDAGKIRGAVAAKAGQVQEKVAGTVGAVKANAGKLHAQTGKVRRKLNGKAKKLERRAAKLERKASKLQDRAGDAGSKIRTIAPSQVTAGLGRDAGPGRKSIVPVVLGAVVGVVVIWRVLGRR